MKEEWKGLGLAELIDLLEPVPEPLPVSMVPQTAGWIWLGLMLLGSFIFLLIRIRQFRRRSAYRREALRELARCGDDPVALAVLLRRTALAAYPRTVVASLFGEDWLKFLDQAYGGNGFTSGPGRLLGTLPYESGDGAGKDGLNPLVGEWIRRHRREAFHV